MKPGHWVSDWKQPLSVLSEDREWLLHISNTLKDKDAIFCERCNAKALDPLCPECLEMIRLEAVAKDVK